jgi:hypothetical protein
MPHFPDFKYTMKEVRRAGEALSTKLIWTNETAPEIVRTFAIAHNWRDSHGYPMNRFRATLNSQIKRHGSAGNAVARLKRMPSIRGKLIRQQWPLDKIQDLAGCRAIVPSIRDAQKLIERMRELNRHLLHKEDPYIEQPKANGYRCHHMVYRYRGDGDDEVFHDRRVEVQVRTWLQHTWATAVEAVGAYRTENMKGGEGSPHWLRLFTLMSAEFAAAENCPEPPGAPTVRSARVREILELDKQLSAADTLENIAHAVKYTENIDPSSEPEYYQIVYDKKNRIVNVHPFYSAEAGARAYDESEVNAEKSQSGVTTVLVEADSIENLKAAYPNYFGDVQMFRAQLRSITQGEAAVEYEMPKRIAPRRTPPRERPDDSWLRGQGHKRWK